MEFSYKISEAEYVKAGKMYLKASGKSGQITKLLFWLLLLGFLVAFWGYAETDPFVVRISPGADGYTYATTGTNRAQTIARVAHTLVVNLGPIAIFGIIAVGVLAFRGPDHRLRAAYRRDPTTQGEYTANLTPEWFSEQNSAGTSWQNRWALYESWREQENLIIVILRSQAYEILNLTALTDPQRAELRALLAAALPQK